MQLAQTLVDYRGLKREREREKRKDRRVSGDLLLPGPLLIGTERTKSKYQTNQKPKIKIEIKNWTLHSLPSRNAHHRPSQRTPPPHASILLHYLFPARLRFNLQAFAFYPRPPQATPSLSMLRSPIRALARCNPPRHIQQQPTCSCTTPCPTTVDGLAQTSL